MVFGKEGLRNTLLSQIGLCFDPSTVARVILIESEIGVALEEYLSRFNHDLRHEFDPNGFIYDSLADPPMLL